LKGIPTHFRVAVILEHAGLFETRLDIETTIVGGRWGSKTFAYGADMVVDVGVLAKSLAVDPGLQERVQGFTGEVPDAFTRFFRRG
jgi:hypothetical protein